MSAFICRTNDEYVGTIAFNRPTVNCYEIEFMQQFNAAIDDMNADSNIRVVIVKSEIERYFSSGADIYAFAENTTETNKTLVAMARRSLSMIESSGKIYIASLNGHALGGGLEIAMACDLRFGGDGPYFLGLPEVKLGLIPGNGGSQRLSRIVGTSKALELTLTGDNISPQEAYRIGLLNRIFPTSELNLQTNTFAHTLANGAPLAMTALKQSVIKGAAMPLTEGLALEASLVDALYDTADAREGFQAFQEKRPPVYSGQ